MNQLEDGIYAAVLTPMRADLSCDVKELARHCLDLIGRGCQGVVLFGTTGEGASFSVEERVEVLGRLIQEGVDPRRIILGNGSSNMPDSVELARAVLKWKCAAFLVAPPSFFKNVTEEGVIAFYREIIQRAGDAHLQILLYHIPQYSGVPITLKIVEVLREEFPHIVAGLKESEGNMPLSKSILESFPGFKLFVAREQHIVEALRLGASGAICGLANLCPELICSLYEQNEKIEELDKFFHALKDLPFIPAFKAWMEKKKGSAWGHMRPPLVPLTPAERKRFVDQ